MFTENKSLTTFLALILKNPDLRIRVFIIDFKIYFLAIDPSHETLFFTLF